MIRTLLTTSAIALVLSTAAIAQTTTTDPATPATPETTQTEPMAPADGTAPADSMTPAAPADATDPAAPATDDAMGTDATETDAMDTDDAATTTMEADEPFDMATGYTAGEGDAIVSQVMGSTVFSSAAEDAEQIGTVNDLVISADGEIHAVVIGVGGFLGIGEKNVAVDFGSLTYETAFDNTQRWVLATTAEALTAAPDFVWEDPNAPAADAMATDPAMAPADPAMAPADPAMAPAAPQ